MKETGRMAAFPPAKMGEDHLPENTPSWQIIVARNRTTPPHSPFLLHMSLSLPRINPAA
ncbi:hypothetical protein GALL_87600 [mine drainage metagenome]|uniref:Uncharacterized protein n=1 Tax=mine drainage metagenome TaxID=410659 RepID=A0A1J5SL01_9ZZZZ